jgi:hypothetical protein
MQRAIQLSGLFVTVLLSTQAFAEDPLDPDADPRSSTEAPQQAEQPLPVLTPAAAVAVPGAVVAPAKPKFGDLSVSGYFRGGFGASNQRGRMTCFALANPAGIISKYRLGNECEVWSEAHFTMVTYVGEDGSVASLHFMPTVYIPTTYIGYTPTGVISSPAQYTTSTGATIAFPNLYADIGARFGETAPIPRFMAKFYEKYQDRLLYGTDMGFDPEMYRLHYRFLETSDESFAYSIEDPPPPVSASGDHGAGAVPVRSPRVGPDSVSQSALREGPS